MNKLGPKPQAIDFDHPGDWIAALAGWQERRADNAIAELDVALRQRNLAVARSWELLAERDEARAGWQREAAANAAALQIKTLTEES